MTDHENTEYGKAVLGNLLAWIEDDPAKAAGFLRKLVEINTQRIGRLERELGEAQRQIRLLNQST